MKKSRAKKPAMPKAVDARPKRKASLPEIMPKARRRLDRPSRKRFAGGGGVSGRPTPSLAEASEFGWTVDNYPPRDLLKHGKIR